MSQDTMLQVLLPFLLVLFVVIANHKSSKQESKPVVKELPREAPRVHKPAPLKPKEASAVWEEEDLSYALNKKPISRAKKVLNRSLLKQSILKAEILRKKY